LAESKKKVLKSLNSTRSIKIKEAAAAGIKPENKYMNLFEKLRQNHLLMMAVCCILPFVFLFILIYGFGIRNNYVYFAALIICPLSHFAMMTFYKDKQKEGSCH